ncbi:hypothetical protein NDU88_002510 [Pleurodeles waltl]|uniref:Uncharacterized protein n=1 Tax=Pleurodeles waltl TaxID=8319 RepID=A0AAV7UDD4_PLEWA|nr:hypothetical protein NDU88_002510 [Pleurodeles waltl]
MGQRLPCRATARESAQFQHSGAGGSDPLSSQATGKVRLIRFRTMQLQGWGESRKYSAGELPSRLGKDISMLRESPPDRPCISRHQELEIVYAVPCVTQTSDTHRSAILLYPAGSMGLGGEAAQPETK